MHAHQRVHRYLSTCLHKQEHSDCQCRLPTQHRRMAGVSRIATTASEAEARPIERDRLYVHDAWPPTASVVTGLLGWLGQSPAC